MAFANLLRLLAKGEHMSYGLKRSSSTGFSASDDIIRALSQAEAIIEFKPDGTILRANQNFLNAVGYELNEITGRHHSMFVDPEEVQSPSYKQFWQSLAAGEHKVAQFKRIAKSGKEIWIQASYNPLKDASGKVYGVIKLASDITAEKLKSFEMEGLVKAIDRVQAVIHFKPDGTILEANENFCDALGYTLNDIKGKHHSMFVFPEEQDSEYKQFWSKLAAGEVQSGEFRRKTRTGDELFINAYYNPVFDDAGHVIKVVKLASDITASYLDQRERREIMTSLGESIVEIESALHAAAEQSNTAASASEEASSNLEGVASGSNQLASSIEEIASKVTQASDLSQDAVVSASQASDIVNGLSNAVQQIGQVTSMISEIASQTNLLALNATIEAARAGESGRGFAVVAGEVKALATQSAKATEEINRQISSVQGSTQEAVRSISGIMNVINEVSSVSGAIAAAVEQQAQVTSDISANMQEATTGVRQITSSVNSIAGATGLISEKTQVARELSEKIA